MSRSVEAAIAAAMARVPPTIAAQLPKTKTLAALRAAEPRVLAPGTRLRRAAWNRDSVLPAKAERAYRFGPPQATRDPALGFPFWWLYVSERGMSCVYEAGFCGNDVRAPGTFYIDPAAEQYGLLASLWFTQPIRLLDLGGDVAFRTGIYDRVSDPDHGWCQWFAWQLDAHGFFTDAGFDGLCYPSRKDRGRPAYALHARFVETARATVRRRVIRFTGSAEYTVLRRSPLRRAPP